MKRGDLTRPIPREDQLVRGRRTRGPLALVAVVIVLALAASVFVLPFRDWLRQGDDLGQRQNELAILEDVNARLESEIERLQTPAGIAEAARDELGFVVPGAERLAIVDRGELPAALPSGWPYSVVTGVLTARTAELALAPVTTADGQ